MKIGSDRAFGFPVINDRPGHGTEYEDTDDDTDPEHQHMETVEFTPQRGHTFGHVERVLSLGRRRQK